METKIAFVTCRDLPELTEDDRLAAAALGERGIVVEPAIWDDPKVDWTAYSMAIVRSCWDYHLKIVAFTKWLDDLGKASLPVWNSTDIVRWNLDKTYLRDLEQKGAEIIRSAWLPRGEEMFLKDFLQDKGWRHAVIKPAISASGYETWLVSPDQTQDFQGKFDELISMGEVIVQEFAPEIQSEGEWSLMFYNKKYSHSILKRPRNGEFRVHTERGGVELKSQADASLIAQAQRIVDLIDESLLYARVDGVVRKGKLLLMELELIEPHLYFGFHPEAAARFADIVVEKLVVKQ